jgi:hypothetical protein
MYVPDVLFAIAKFAVPPQLSTPGTEAPEVVVVVVDVDVVDVVVPLAHGMVCVIEFVQVPVDVTVTWVAKSSTLTTFPGDSNCVLVAVDGVTLPTSAVRLKFGPKSAPKPTPNVNVILLAIFLILLIYNFKLSLRCISCY